jgi:hypothetical protein
MPEAERAAMASRAYPCFTEHYSMFGATEAINEIFSTIKFSRVKPVEAEHVVRPVR